MSMEERGVVVLVVTMQAKASIQEPQRGVGLLLFRILIMHDIQEFQGS